MDVSGRAGDYTVCFSEPKVKLPTGYLFGLSAQTGALVGMLIDNVDAVGSLTCRR